MGRAADLILRLEERLASLKAFVAEGIWEHDYSEKRGLQWFLLRQFQVLLLVAKGLRADRLQLRAAALTVVTLLAVVPVFAVLFSYFDASGALADLQARFEAFIFENLAVGARDEVIAWVRGVVAGANSQAIGGLGLGALLLVGARIIAAMEEAFNVIWGVRRGRPLVARVVLYWSLLTAGPLLFAASLAGTTWLQSWIVDGLRPTRGVGIALDLVSSLLTVAGLTFMYLVIPNTRVKFRHALLGGVVAGAFFEAAKYGYAWSVANLFRYNALYGSFGAVPVFIIWVNITWVIVLFGCELSFANQNVGTLRHEQRAHRASLRFRELLAVRLLLEVAVDFLRGASPPTASDLSGRLAAPVRLVNEVLGSMAGAGLLREAASADPQDPGYVPGRPLDRVTVEDVIRAIREERGVDLDLPDDERQREIAAVLGRAWSAAAEVTREVDFLRLAERFVGSADSEAPAQVHPLRP